MRHVVRVMRPTKNKGTRGQLSGNPETIIKEWPCSIETLSGREVVQARTVFAEATHQVKGYGDPDNRLKATDYLTGGSIGDRKLAIGFINDKNQNGRELTLLCGERT